MKKIYLMGLTSFFALAATAQTTLKVNKPLQIGQNAVISELNGVKKGATAKTGGPNTPMAILGNMAVSTSYTAGTAQNINMVLTLTNTDLEFGDKLDITFPAGITVNSTTNTPTLGPDDGGASSDGPEAFVGIVGQTITWGNDDNYYGGICPTNAAGGPLAAGYPIQINITVPPGTTGNIVCTYSVSGDGFGASPADFTGSFNILDATAPAINITTNAIGVLTGATTLAAEQNCSLGTHTIVSQIKNLGNTTESNIPVNYSVNGVASTLGAFPGPLAPGDSALVLFPVTYNFSAQNVYMIKTWCAAVSDNNLTNDTAAAMVVNSIPVALTSTTYTNGIQTSYDFNSITPSWAGLGLGFSVTNTMAHSGGLSLLYNINNTTMGAPNGTYETMNILPCMDITTGDTYKISFWKKSSTAAGLAVNGQTGVFSGLVNDIASMTDVLKPYSALVPTALPATAGWLKDSVNYVATATETRYFAIGGKGSLTSASQQINVRLDDIKIEKVTSGVGIKSISANNSISIFPNPTTGLLNINAVEVNSSVDVYNVIGDKVYSNTLVKGNNVVDLSGLANGAYFVKLNSNNQITTKKVVLTK
jgi:hypothetical protein